VLNLNNRKLYLEAIKPPAGYQFDRAVGTSYSLDLLTLLVLPLSFVLFDYKGKEDNLQSPLEILEALQRTSHNFSVFCHKGEIKIPNPPHLLYSYLEPNVVEVEPAAEGKIFHPKVWFLRYTAADDKPIYKFLCLSKNLTFDRSLDVMVMLEGKVGPEEEWNNEPLQDFLQELPRLSAGSYAEHVDSDIELMASEILKVNFEPPPGFKNEILFHPQGIAGYNNFPLAGNFNRFLAISPFLSEGFFNRLNTDDGLKMPNNAGNVLVSLLESLDGINQTLSPFDQIYVMDDALPLPEQGGEELAAQPAEVRESEEQLRPGSSRATSIHNGSTAPGDSKTTHLDLPHNEDTAADSYTGHAAEAASGDIHAKLYLAEKAHESRLWLGSSNATGAAFNGNVEFLVELAASPDNLNIDTILGDGQDSMLMMLKEYRPSSLPPEIDEEKKLQKELENLLDQNKKQLIKAGLGLEVTNSPIQDLYQLSLVPGAAADLDPRIEVKGWPITLGEPNARSLTPLLSGEAVVFEEITVEGITSFLAIEIIIREGGREEKERFVLNLPIEGVPSHRSDKILRRIISDSSSFLRYLLLLLSEGDNLNPEMGELIDQLKNSGASVDSDNPYELPLLEELVRALARHPQKIDRIARLIDKLSGDGDSEENILPKGFDQIWEPIWQERKRMG